MPAPTLLNLALYALQAGLLIGAFALMVAALQPSPSVRLAACRGLLVVLFLLPLQVLLREAPAALPAFDVPARGVTLVVDPAIAQASASLPWGAIVGSVLALGIVLRAVWLAVGLARLRRLSRELPVESAGSAEAEVAALQDALGTRARVVFGERVAQPVTFGVAPAVVVLPSSLLAAPAERRRAVLCHELLHVRRRDWLWVLGEELALTVLWFHPAAWWLVGELQLAREQVVDRLTVAATGARRDYMDALFSAVDLPAAPPLLSGFLRRRHLARRLVSLAEEVAMSRLRLLVGSVVMAVVVLVSGAVGLAAWPLTPAPSNGQDLARIEAERARVLSKIEAERDSRMGFVPRREPVRVISRVEVPFPAIAGRVPFGELVVDVEAAVDASGGVTAAKAATVSVHGSSDAVDSVSVAETPVIDAAAAGAVEAIRGWRFEAPAATPAAVLVRVRFAAETRAATVTGVSAVKGYAGTPVLRVAKSPARLVKVDAIYPQEARDAKVQGVVIVEMTIDVDGSVSEAWVVQSVPMLDEAALQAVRQWKFEPTLLNGVAIPVRVSTTVAFTLRP